MPLTQDTYLLTRRFLLGAGGLLVGVPISAWSAGVNAASPWLPYADSKVLSASAGEGRTRTDLSGVEGDFSEYRRVAPRPAVAQAAAAASSPPAQGRAPSSAQVPRVGVPGAVLRQPPLAYVRTAVVHNIDPWILYGVALQESSMKFGAHSMPFPWTLCVQGRGQRYNSYAEALAAARRQAALGITNIDCGAMQLNWHWHQSMLGSFERALDPYPNLAMGAQLLLAHRRTYGNWFTAIGVYHTGSLNPNNRTRAQYYARSVLQRLQRLGVKLTTAGVHIAMCTESEVQHA